MLIDIVLLIVLLYFTIKGLIRGAVLELFSLVGLIISILLTKKYTYLLYELAVRFLKVRNSSLDINSNYYIYLFTYALTFIVFYFTLYFIILILKKFIKLVMLNWADSFLGMFLGFAKGSLISILFFSFLAFLGTYEKTIMNQIKKSYSGKVIPSVAKQAYFMLPAPIKRKIEQFRTDESIDKFLDNLMKDYRK